MNVSSIGAPVSNPGSGYYTATKLALEGVSDALRREAAPLGIRVVIVEPGAFRTDFAGRSLAQSRAVIDDYADTAGKRRKENDTSHGTQPGDPDRAARAIVDVVCGKDAPARLLLAPMPSGLSARSTRTASTRSTPGRTSAPPPISPARKHDRAPGDRG